MRVVVEVVYRLELDVDWVADAHLIGSDLRIKHPQTSETLAPVETYAWDPESDDDTE